MRTQRITHSIRIEATPLFNPRDHSIKAIRITQSTNGKVMRGFMVNVNESNKGMEAAKAAVRQLGINKYGPYARIKVIWPFA